MIKWHQYHPRFLVPLSVAAFSVVVGISGLILTGTPVRADMGQKTPITKMEECKLMMCQLYDGYLPACEAPPRKPRRD